MKTHQRFINRLFLTAGLIGITKYWGKRLSKCKNLSLEISYFLDFYEVTDEKARIRLHSLREIVSRRLGSNLESLKETLRSNPDSALIVLKTLFDLQSKSKRMEISIITDEIFDEITNLRKIIYGDLFKNFEEIDQIPKSQIFFLVHNGDEEDINGLLEFLATVNNWDPVGVAEEAINYLFDGKAVNHDRLVSVFQTNKTLIGHPAIYERLSEAVEKGMLNNHPCSTVLHLYGSLRQTLP